MPTSYSKKRIRNQEIFERWDQHPDSDFVERGISREAVKAVQGRLLGKIILPRDPCYNTDRKLFDPVFDPHPSMIVYCAGASDVAEALGLAAQSGQPFTVRSSGHCTGGFSGGSGVMIDVSLMNSITVDVAAQTATVGPGCTFDLLNKTLDKMGLHVPGGECPDVCVAGYVQGGGYGFTSVTFGMSCDNVISFEVMLADGSIVMASESVNYDLWWALRGGTGGNYGIVLAITYQLRPLGSCFGWALLWPLASDQDIQNATAALMLLQQQYMLASPYAPQMNIQVTFCYQNQIYPGPLPPPGTPLLPYLLVRGLYVGDTAAGQAAIQPLQQVPGCVTQWTLTSSFLDLNDKLLNLPQGLPYLDPPPPPAPYFDKSSRYVAQDLTAAQWTAILNYFLTSQNNRAYGYLEFYGGAINAYPWEKNAFTHRTSSFNAVMDVFWYDDADRAAAEAFLTGWNELLFPVWNMEIYQNYCTLASPDYSFNYWTYALAGLWMVKIKYDPNNAFTFAQQVSQPGPDPGGMKLPPGLQAAIDQPIQYLTKA